MINYPASKTPDCGVNNYINTSPHHAPLFVWYEVAFACGYDPALKQQLDAAVANRHAAWDL